MERFLQTLHGRFPCFVPKEHPKQAWYQERLALYRREIERCWRKYELRNRSLVHLASNILLLLCAVHDCSLLSMESLKTLKSTGRGRGVAVATAGLFYPPASFGKNVLRPWLASFSVPAIVTAQSCFLSIVWIAEDCLG